MGNKDLSHQPTNFRERLRQKEQECGLTDRDIASTTRWELFKRLEASVGNTPLRMFSLENGNVLYQKDETHNPTETHYDRCYVELLRDLESERTITPGDILLETTSGSAGISFAWIAKKLGYSPVVFAPSFVPQPRLTEIENLADELHLSDDRKNYMLAAAGLMRRYFVQKREELQGSSCNVYMPNHSQDFRTPTAFERVAWEVNLQLSGGSADYFIGGVGNGATLLGIGSKLKALNKKLQVLAFEPQSACPYYRSSPDSWGSLTPASLQGLHNSGEFSFHSLPGIGGFGKIDFPFMDKAIQEGIIDDICLIPDELVVRAQLYNDGLPPERQQGNTSLVSRYIVEEMAKNTGDKAFLSLVYDKADRY